MYEERLQSEEDIRLRISVRNVGSSEQRCSQSDVDNLRLSGLARSKLGTCNFAPRLPQAIGSNASRRTFHERKNLSMVANGVRGVESLGTDVARRWISTDSAYSGIAAGGLRTLLGYWDYTHLRQLTPSDGAGPGWEFSLLHRLHGCLHERGNIWTSQKFR